MEKTFLPPDEKKKTQEVKGYEKERIGDEKTGESVA